jgi:hypothetical protein
VAPLAILEVTRTADFYDADVALDRFISADRSPGRGFGFHRARVDLGTFANPGRGQAALLLLWVGVDANRAAVSAHRRTAARRRGRCAIRSSQRERTPCNLCRLRHEVNAATESKASGTWGSEILSCDGANCTRTFPQSPHRLPQISAHLSATDGAKSSILAGEAWWAVQDLNL